MSDYDPAQEIRQLQGQIESLKARCGIAMIDGYKKGKDEAADEIERLQSLLETANAYGAGENAARIAERELLAQMMIRQSLSTGHGDTVGDLVRELEPQIKRMRAEIVTLRNAAVNADERTDMLRGKLATAVLAHIDATAESDLLRVEVAALKKDAERNP